MSEIQIVKVDQGGVNARILAKEAKADFRRVEAASLKMPTRFTSAEGKRFFARLFNTLQLNTHFISVIARTRLDHEDVAKIEDTIRAQMDAVTETSTTPSTAPKRYSRPWHHQHGDLRHRAAGCGRPCAVVHRATLPGGAGQTRPTDALAADPGDSRSDHHPGGGYPACGSQTAGARCRQWRAELCDGVAAADERHGRARWRSRSEGQTGKRPKPWVHRMARTNPVRNATRRSIGRRPTPAHDRRKPSKALCLWLAIRVDGCFNRR
jgi:hypothetical protein